MLRRFVSERGKIRSRRITGACRRHQSQIARAVKRARELALLPYVAEPGERRVRVNFTLAGLVDVQTGTLQLAPSGTTGNVTGATLNVASGAVLNPAVTSVNYTGTITGTGAGTVGHAGGNLVVPTGATFNFPDGLFQWSAGQIIVPGGVTLTNAKTGFMTVNPASGNVVRLAGLGTLSNLGTVRQTGAGDLRISDNSAGTFTTLDTPAALARSATVLPTAAALSLVAPVLPLRSLSRVDAEASVLPAASSMTCA